MLKTHRQPLKGTTLKQFTKSQEVSLRGDSGPNQDFPVKTVDGTTIKEDTAGLERLREQFKKILKRPDQRILLDIDKTNKTDKDLEIETE